MVAKATTLLPQSAAPVIGDAVELPKASTPRGFQVNLTGEGQVSAAVQIQSSLDGINFFTIWHTDLDTSAGRVSEGFYFNGDFGPLTRAELLSISGAHASVEVLTA